MDGSRSVTNPPAAKNIGAAKEIAESLDLLKSLVSFTSQVLDEDLQPMLSGGEFFNGNIAGGEAEFNELGQGVRVRD
jgi:hypothetical protein